MMVKIMSNSKKIKEKVHFSVSILAGAVQTLDFNLTKKPDLVLIAVEFFQYNYILSLACLLVKLLRIVLLF